MKKKNAYPTNIYDEVQPTFSDTINMSLNFPHYKPHRLIKKSLTHAIKENHYTSSDNNKALADLKNYLSYYYKYFPNEKELLLTPSSKYSLFLLCQNLLKKDEEVIIFAPVNPNYQSLITLCGANVKIIPLSIMNYSINFSALEKAINRKTKMIIINSPNNPTGKVLPYEDIDRLITLAKNKNIYLVSDESYARFDYYQRFKSLVPYSNRENIIIIESLSKSFFISGYCLAYILANQKIINLLSTFHQQLNIPNFIPSQALLSIINHPKIQEDFTIKLQVYLRNKEIIENFLKKHHIDYIVPDGAFYIFINILKFGTDKDIVEALNNRCHIIVSPGSLFGNEYHSYIRINYAIKQEKVFSAIAKIEETFHNELK